jgi:hypothetical protein
LDYQDLGGLSEKMPSGRAPQIVEEARSLRHFENLIWSKERDEYLANGCFNIQR